MSHPSQKTQSLSDAPCQFSSALEGTELCEGKKRVNVYKPRKLNDRSRQFFLNLMTLLRSAVFCFVFGILFVFISQFKMPVDEAHQRFFSCLPVRVCLFAYSVMAVARKHKPFVGIFFKAVYLIKRWEIRRSCHSVKAVHNLVIFFECHFHKKTADA